MTSRDCATYSLATSGGNTQAVEGAEPVRVLIQAGTLVRSVALYAIAFPDGAVDVIAVDIDL